MNLDRVAHSLEINGLTYALRESGAANGQPVWLLHGLLDTGASFGPLAAALEALSPGRYRFLAPDWRGHGSTAWTPGDYWFPLYLADLDKLIGVFTPDQDIVLVGHSMGGQAASQYAGLRPERITGLVALDSLNVPDSSADSARERYTAWLDAMNQPPLPRRFDSPAALMQRLGKRYPELDEPTREWLAAQWVVAEDADDDAAYRLHADPWHHARLPYGFRVAESMAIWRRVNAAVQCIDGGASPPARRYMSEDDMAARHACFGRFERVVIDSAGHMLHLQMPTRVARLMHDFLSRIDS